MDTTKEWLTRLLVMNNDDDCRMITRNGKSWKSIAGFSQYGNVFAVYQNESNYCVHSADEWKENEEPNMGYYDKSLTYDDLIGEIAETYDRMLRRR